MSREEATNKLAHIICDAAKGGYIPFNVDGEYCAMSIARSKINEFLPPVSDTVEVPIPNLDEAAYNYRRNLPGYSNPDEVEESFKAGAQWRNELGTKDADLEEEINRFWDSCIKHKNEMGGNVIWSNKLEVEVLARHFYELGLNKSK